MRLPSIIKSLLLLCHMVAVDSRATDWSNINGGIIYKNKTTFQIKGVNYFGMETCDYVPHGLWQHPLTWYLDFIKSNNFNVIRVPFSQQWVKTSFLDQRPDPSKVSADPSLQGKTSVEILDILFDECSKRGIFILLDMHRLKCDAQSHELWYSLDSTEYTSDTFFASWRTILERYSDHPSFHAIDLLNEPRGLTEWGTDPSRSWNMFVESAFSNIPDYKGIIYVEGIDWGRNFAGMKKNPIKVDPTRIVFSPHVYGPSVVGGTTDLDERKLHAYWYDIFGFLVTQKRCCVIGEWGGRYEGADREWQDKFVDYLLSVRVPGIYWCLNPDSMDTGGLLANDWTTPQEDKLALLARLQPTPTIVEPLLDDHATNVTSKRCKCLPTMRNLRGWSPN